MDRTGEPGTLIRALAETAERIDAVSRQLSADQFMTPPEPGSWSPNEILWHIRAQADVYGEHIGRIINEETPHWRHVSPRARMKKARYDELPFAESLAAFVQQRAELVALLEALAPEAWGRFALVRVKDKESKLTLQERVWGMATHEAIHWAQLEQVGATLSNPEKGAR